jgi:hypothetical protein
MQNGEGRTWKVDYMNIKQQKHFTKLFIFILFADYLTTPSVTETI